MAQQGGFDFNRMSMGTKGILISGAVLLISLFLPWQSFGVDLGPFGGNIGGSVSGFNGLGIIVFLLVLGVLVWEIVVAVTTINTGNVSPALISAGIAAATVLFAVIHFLTSLSGVSWGAFIGLLAALALGYAAWLRFNESKTDVTGGGAPPPPPA